MILSFILNGQPVQVEAFPHQDLMNTLRDKCNITSVRRGSSHQNSGLSMILMDGLPVPSVLVPSFRAEGSDIVTYEGIVHTEECAAITRTFSSAQVIINPLAYPTLILLVYWAISENQNIDESEIRELLGEIACRGGITSRIISAVQRAQTRYRRQSTAFGAIHG